MSAPDFTRKVREIHGRLQAARDGSESGWKDKQGENFRTYHVDSILKEVNDLEVGIQSHADKIEQALNGLRSL